MFARLALGFEEVCSLTALSIKILVTSWLDSKQRRLSVCSKLPSPIELNTVTIFFTQWCSGSSGKALKLPHALCDLYDTAMRTTTVPDLSA